MNQMQPTIPKQIMSMNHFLLSAFLLALIAACSSTPGDAAYQAGQSDIAANLYHRGALQGDAKAALKLGLMISEKAALIEKYGVAGQWFIRACDLGNSAGCHNAGVGYEYGAAGKAGLGKDLNKALSYYQRAADRGYMSSQYNLGSLYSNQYFSDDIAGLKWLLVSQASARTCSSEPICKWVLEDSPGHILRMRQRMSKESQAQAEQLAKKWFAKK